MRRSLVASLPLVRAVADVGEQVVLDLERDAEVVAVGAERFDHTLRSAAEHGPALAGAAEEGRGLAPHHLHVGGHVADAALGDLGLEGLPAAEVHARARDDLERRHDALGRDALAVALGEPEEDVEEQGVARHDGVVDAEARVEGLLSASHRVLVDDVVVHEARDVGAFGADRGRQDALGISARRDRGLHEQHRPEELAGGAQRVRAHRVERMRVLLPTPVQCGLEPALTSREALVAQRLGGLHGLRIGDERAGRRERRERALRGARAAELAHGLGDAGRVEVHLGEEGGRVTVLDRLVGDAETARRRVDAGPGQALEHGASEAAHHAVLLDRHDDAAALRVRHDLARVERLGEARVQHGGLDPLGREGLGGRTRVRDAAPERHDQHVVAAAEQLGLADRQRPDLVVHRDAESLATRVAEGGRALELDRGSDHVLELVLVLGRHQHDVGQRPQVRDVVEPLVRGPVRADQARAIHRERHVEVLHADVVHDLIERALQEGRVDRGDGLHALGRETGREADRVLFGDPGVVVALGQGGLEAVQARPVGHRGRDAHDALVRVREPNEAVGEDGLVLGRAGRRFRERARGRLELADPVVAVGIVLGGPEAVALVGVGVHDHGAATRGEQSLRLLEPIDQRVDVVSRNGSEVLEVERAGEMGDRVERRGRAVRASGVARGSRAQRAHIGCDRHPVVVHDDDEVLLAQSARVVERLERHSGRERAVADQRDCDVRVALALERLGHSERGRDRRARMPGTERVVGRFRTPQELAHPAALADRGEAVDAARQDLVRVPLVPHVEHEAVVGRVEHEMDGREQLHRAEARREVSPRLGYALGRSPSVPRARRRSSRRGRGCGDPRGPRSPRGAAGSGAPGRAVRGAGRPCVRTSSD